MSSPIEAAIQIILNGGSSVASFNMNEKDIEKFMVQDFIFTDSDGSDGHPRKYGTFPKLLREYVLHEARADAAAGRPTQQRDDARSCSASRIAACSRRATSPTSSCSIRNTVADRSTYEQPTLLAVGMKYVLVNGVLAIDDGRYTGRDGRASSLAKKMNGYRPRRRIDAYG